MLRRLQTSRKFIAALSVLVALGLGATRSEKMLLELAGQLGSLAPVTAEAGTQDGGWFFFDTSRVLQSGGTTARLLESFNYRFTA